MKLFDLKVQQACVKISAAASDEFTKLEVPFFCAGTDFGPSEQDKQELRGLRRQMMHFLQDYLTGDEAKD